MQLYSALGPRDSALNGFREWPINQKNRVALGDKKRLKKRRILFMSKTLVKRSVIAEWNDRVQAAVAMTPMSRVSVAVLCSFRAIEATQQGH